MPTSQLMKDLEISLMVTTNMILENARRIKELKAWNEQIVLDYEDLLNHYSIIDYEKEEI